MSRAGIPGLQSGEDVNATRLLTTAQAAAVLGASKVTVLAYAKRGRLEPRRLGRGWAFDGDAVLALREELELQRERWISIDQARALTGLTEWRIKQGVESGAIAKRRAPKNHPTLDRAMVLRYAAQLVASPPPPPLRRRPSPPSETTVWLSMAEAASRLGVTPQRVGQLARAERLPATRRGRFWWFREEDIARRNAARQFVLSTAELLS